jgi:hypothetical protein
MTFLEILNHHFPGVQGLDRFVQSTQAALHAYGFSSHNSIACAGVCRDEITRPLVDAIQEAWGEAFNFSSLAGMLFLGKTGFLAAQNHSPRADGREHYIFYALTHIALGEQGEIGLCYRTGRDEPSNACGALAALQVELAAGELDLSLDPLDVEMSLIKKRLAPLIAPGVQPDLLDLTRLAHRAIQEDLEAMLKLTIQPGPADYAVFTGIQIHAPDRATFVWPGSSYAVVRGEKISLKLSG